MRKVMMLLVATVCMAAQASEKNDTTVIENAKKVTVISNESMQKIKVVGKEGDSDYRYENVIQLKDSSYCRRVETKEKKEHNLDLDLAFGWGIPTNVPDGLSFSTAQSWEWIVGLRYKYTPKKALQTYSTGLWLNWRNYGLDTDKMFVKGADKVVELADYPKGAGDKLSSIYIFGLSVPFLFTQQFGKNNKWSFTLGPVVNFNLYGRLVNEYEMGDDAYEIRTKDFDYRFFTVDLMGRIAYRDIGIYCKYSPMSVLKKDKGPQFHSLSIGVFF